MVIWIGDFVSRFCVMCKKIVCVYNNRKIPCSKLTEAQRMRI